MDSTVFACGDAPISPREGREMEIEDKKRDEEIEQATQNLEQMEEITNEITPQAILDHETRLKDRIAQCKNVIENLKLELNAEKTKWKQTKHQLYQPESSYETLIDPLPEKNNNTSFTSARYSDKFDQYADLSFASNMYSACVESKLNCDENLLEYEKQLEQYQNTLNMAQITKKNAIRKQMLAKAFRLKLMEVENQCNIELLRVKQSLQCLEPLQMIANKWKTETNDNDSYSTDSFQLSIPHYQEMPDHGFGCTSSENGNSCSDSPKMEKIDEHNATINTELSEE